MKYEKEIKEALLLIVPEEGKDDPEQFINFILMVAGLSYEKLSQDIQTGVDNGYSVEYQLNLIKKILVR